MFNYEYEKIPREGTMNSKVKVRKNMLGEETNLSCIKSLKNLKNRGNHGSNRRDNVSPKGRRI